MKTYINTIFILLCGIHAIGQTECDNNVSTDFEAPTNDALPSGVDSDKYLNGFNWFPLMEYQVLNV